MTIRSKAIFILLLSALLGAFFGFSSRPTPLDLNSNQFDFLVRKTCDSIFETFGKKYWYKSPHLWHFIRDHTTSYPFPTEWPPTPNTGVWIAYSPIDYKAIGKPIFIHATAYRKPSEDSAKYVNGEGNDEYGELVGSLLNMTWYHPLPDEPTERFPYFVVTFSPTHLNGYKMEVDTMSGDLSDWLMETNHLQNHPGQMDLFRAIKEIRLPSPQEKTRIRDFYWANLIEYQYQDYKHLQPGQREFLEWLIKE